MNRLYRFFLCTLIMISSAFANTEPEVAQQTLVGRLRGLVSHNPKLLKIAAGMGLSTLCLFLCYRLGFKSFPKTKDLNKSEPGTDKNLDNKRANIKQKARQQPSYNPGDPGSWIFDIDSLGG